MTTLKPPFTAKNMKELYNNVTSGKFKKIPSRYSLHL